MDEAFTSAADLRGVDWIEKWSGLGNGLTNDPKTGNLMLSHSGDDQSKALAVEIMDDPILAHAVGRFLLEYHRRENRRQADEAR
ncbi:hypothetical protein [Sphingomonas sp. VDB2]|uniref:hypothetical protein n=1 Tax=Sphingomonas sp. VDB2 TaxID=3228751 RepID=UPI003A801CD7